MTLTELYRKLPPALHSRITVAPPFVFYDDGTERYVAIIGQDERLVAFDKKTRLAFEVLMQ